MSRHTLKVVLGALVYHRVHVGCWSMCVAAKLMNLNKIHWWIPSCAANGTPSLSGAARWEAPIGRAGGRLGRARLIDGWL